MPHGKHRPGVTPHTTAYPDALWQRVQQLAARTGVAASVVVRAAVEDYLRRSEA